MAQNSEGFLDAINRGLLEVQQETLFGSEPIVLENACADYLRHKGYSVKEPLIYPYNIKKLDDLIVLFYVLLSKYNDKDTIVYKNKKQDLKIAKYFVESIQHMSGLSKPAAMGKCATLIKIVFNNVDRFKFTIPLTFGIFGQKNMAWVTQLAIKILNEEMEEYKEQQVDKKIDEMLARYPQSEIGWSDNKINLALKNQGEKLNA